MSTTQDIDLSQLQPDGPGASSEAGQDAGKENSKRQQEEEMKRDLLATVLDSGARERCSDKACLATTIPNIRSTYSIPSGASSSLSCYSNRVDSPSYGTIWATQRASDRPTTDWSSGAGSSWSPAV